MVRVVEDVYSSTLNRVIGDDTLVVLLGFATHVEAAMAQMHKRCEFVELWIEIDANRLHAIITGTVEREEF